MRQIRGNAVSMIFQEPATSLNPVYTVGVQIVEALRLHRGLGRSQAREEAGRLLREVGIADGEDRLDDYPHQLSGGMRQRVMIAMALSCEPDLLVADEPTTALDVTTQAQILMVLAEVQRSRGMGLLLITHDLGVVAQVCDRMVVMYAGQVVEEGPVSEVFAAPRHPYTRGLLDSLPSVERSDRPLRAIPGTVPPATDWPSGCRFRQRCAHAVDACGEAQEVRPVGPGDRRVRCCRAEELGALEGVES
jgi:oligopeptide/dipeptide ABC transporter ATP-binding protein